MNFIAVVELDRASLYRYPGNYGRYLELKAARIAAEDAEADRARTKLRKESEWMAKQPRARQAKSKARQDQFYELVSVAKGRTPDPSQLKLSSKEESDRQKRLGGVVAEFRSAKYVMDEGRVLLDDFTYSFRQRDRIGVVGNNGVGKSTFLKVLTGKLPLNSGSVKLGETVQIGYYEQTGLNITEEQEMQPVLKFVQEAVQKTAPTSLLADQKGSPKFVVEDISAVGRRKKLAGKDGGINVSLQEGPVSGPSIAFSEREAMSLLTRFQFPSKRWYDRVGQLSGGERRRLQLLQVLASSPNVLLLDEPSNDLDIATLQALEDYITEVFTGCLVIVSHDNFFVNRVAEHLFVFEGDGVVRDFQGSYTEYLEYRQFQQSEEKEAKSLEKAANSRKSAEEVIEVKTVKEIVDVTANSMEAEGKVLGYKERKEMNKLEKDIEKLEKLIADGEKELLIASDSNKGYSILAEITNRLDVNKSKLAKAEERWLELQE